MPELPFGLCREASRRARGRGRRGPQSIANACKRSRSSSQERDGLSVDEALVARAGEIAALFAETGRYAKAKEDLPGVDREAEGMRAKLEALAKRLGLAQSADIKSRQPSDAELALLRALSREGRAIEGELASLAMPISRASVKAHSLLRQDNAARGTPIDPEPLRERLAALAPVLRRLEQRAEIEPAIEAETRAIAEAALRLSPPIASLDALAGASLPAPRDDRALPQGARSARKIIGSRARRFARGRARLPRRSRLRSKSSKAARAVPSLEAIAAARGERETAWERLRAALFGAALPAPARASSVATFELQVAHADRLADEALGDAKRVAQHALHTRDLLVARERQAKAEETLAEAELAMREHEAEMAGRLGSLGHFSSSARRDGELVGQCRGLARSPRATARASPRSFARSPQKIVRLRPCCGRPRRRPGSPTSKRHRACSLRPFSKRAFADWRTAWETARGQKAKVEASRARIEELDALVQEAASRSANGRERWRALLPKLRLPLDATLDEAEAAIDTWGEVPEALRLLAREERRIAGMRRDNAEFEKRVSDLLSTLAPDLLGYACRDRDQDAA